MSMPVNNGGFYQSSPQINFSWISEAWGYFRQQAGAWVGAVAIYILLSMAVWFAAAFPTGYFGYMSHLMQFFMSQIGTGHAVTSMGGMPPPPGWGMVAGFTVLIAGARYLLSGGLYRMALRQVRGEQIKSTDIFAIGDVALPLLLLGLIAGIVAVLGQYGCGLPSLAFEGLFVFVPLVIVDKKLPIMAAIREGFGLIKSQWLMAILFTFVLALVAGLGTLACGVGLIATYPLLFLGCAVGYVAFTNPMQPLPTYGVAQPGVWPPPPSAPQTYQTPPPQFGQSASPPPHPEAGPSGGEPPVS